MDISYNGDFIVAMTYQGSQVDQVNNRMQVYQSYGDNWANHISSFSMGDLGQGQHNLPTPMSFENGILVYFTHSSTFQGEELNIKKIY